MTGRESALVHAARNLLDAIDARHDYASWPDQYEVPWACATALCTALVAYRRVTVLAAVSEHAARIDQQGLGQT